MLDCGDCPGLASLPALPVALADLYCGGCPGLASLSALPTTLMHLNCGYWTAIPDAYPPALTSLNGVPANRRLWHHKVAERHARQRAAVAWALPALALLYV